MAALSQLFGVTLRSLQSFFNQYYCYATMNSWVSVGAVLCCLVAVAFSLCFGAIQLLLTLFKQPKDGSLDIGLFLQASSGDVITIAHRGGQFEAPENTLTAIETAHTNGAHAVELDLDFTADRVAVLFHDDFVDRTTDGVGPLREKTFKEIQQLNAAYSFKHRNNDSVIRPERVPTLEEAVRLCMKLKMKIFLDVKGDRNLTISELQRLQKILPEIAGMVLVTSFKPDLLYQVRRYAPQFTTALISRHHYLSHTMTGIPYYSSPLKHHGAVLLDAVASYAIDTFLPELIGASAMVLNKNQLSNHVVKAIRKRGLEVVAWTVNNPIEKRYFAHRLRVPIITDAVIDCEECGEQTG